VAFLGARVTEPVSRAASTPDDERPNPRPLIERIALAGIAVLVAGLFGGIGVAAFAGGEVFLGVMGGIGALMTVWAAASNLRRG
jgi:hypothetical protein